MYKRFVEGGRYLFSRIDKWTVSCGRNNTFVWNDYYIYYVSNGICIITVFNIFIDLVAVLNKGYKKYTLEWKTLNI